MACPSCGREPPADAAFCPFCGAALTPSERAREERKLVSVVFVDLVGSTSEAERLDPEDVKDALQAFHARTKREIERFGGTVEKFIGDAVMAVFGAPVAHGDDAERAVRAGLRVLDALVELDRERPGTHSLQVRAAVNTGEAVIVVGSRPESGEALAMGDVVNTAARLQTAAPVGSLIVGEETYRATRHVIRYQRLEPVQAKGKRDPVEAWLAIAPIGAPAERPATSSPLVGRTRELGLLDSIWERTAVERRPHLITLVGPTGIGKSRMAAEVVARAEAAGARALRGRSLPYGQTSYRAFNELVRMAAGIYEADEAEEARRKLRERIQGLASADEAEETTRLLSALLGLGADEHVEEPVQLFFAARRLVELLAAEQPTVFVFEDIHWADAAQLDLIEYLATHVRDAPAMLLALARSELLEVRPGWGSGILGQTTIPLEALSAIDSAAIASYLLSGGGDLSPVERVVEVAEGNPLFIEELAAALAEGGGSEALPTTIRAAIASRIDALPAGPRETLMAASVIGKHFWRGVLRSLDDLEGVDESLDALEARDLVRREPTSQVQGDAEYSFKHILIREVAYATLSRADRRRRHAAIARYIEEALGGRTRNLAWVLAHHWREADEPTRSVPYLIEAAELADEQLAFHHAVELYGSALALLAEDDPRRPDLTVRRAITAQRLYHAVADPGSVRWERDAEQP